MKKSNGRYCYLNIDMHVLHIHPSKMLTNPMGIPGVKWYKAADDGKYLKGRIHFQFNNDFDAF